MEHIENIERYLRREMTGDEKKSFEALLVKNDVLAKELKEYEILFAEFEHAQNKAYVQQQIRIAKDQEQRSTHFIASTIQYHINKYWRTAAIAAGVAFLASSLTFFIAEKTIAKRQNERILQLVNKEVRAIKKNQVSIQKDLNVVRANSVPDYPSDGSGTAFALSNNGYAITNLHVIDGGKSIFIFTKEGIAHKCNIVSKDKENDIAILKIMDSNFSFSDQPVPYQLSKEASLASAVFTLGYPKNEVVYNEGYISSLNGKDGDNTKYQLELPSSPGVSGAPVLDDKGNLIGMINSKESQSKGITYVIKSNIVQQVLDSLETNNTSINLNQNKLAGRSRTSQIKSLEDFVFMVKVYNK